MKKLTRTRLKAFLQEYATSVPILDIGAGGTDYASIFPNRYTVDIDPARHPDIVADAERLPFPDSSYEVVLCSEVFEHLRDPKKVVAEIERVLAPGGMLILTTRFVFPVHDAPGDYLRFTPYGLRQLFEGWEIQELRAEADPFTTIAVLLQRILFQTRLRGGKATKAVVYLFARMFEAMAPLVVEQWGDIKRTRPEDIFLSSGLYLVCRNRKTVK